jgi:hypothetical protein
MQKALEAAGVVIQDNSPMQGYTLVITPEAMQIAETNLGRSVEGGGGGKE